MSDAVDQALLEEALIGGLILISIIVGVIVAALLYDRYLVKKIRTGFTKTAEDSRRNVESRLENARSEGYHDIHFQDHGQRI